MFVQQARAPSSDPPSILRTMILARTFVVFRASRLSLLEFLYSITYLFSRSCTLFAMPISVLIEPGNWSESRRTWMR